MSRTDRASISVVIITLNRGERIVPAIESVLNQDYDQECYELVVVDNGSDDNTSEVLTRLSDKGTKLRSVFEPQRGMSSARNKGIATARYVWILFLDDDAVAVPGLLAAYASAISECPRAVAFGGYAEVKRPGKVPWWWSGKFDAFLSAVNHGSAIRELKFPKIPYGLNMMIRSDVLRGLGGFQKIYNQYGLGDDTDMFWRISRAGHRVVYVPDAKVTHCVSEDRFQLSSLVRRVYRGGAAHAAFDQANGSGWMGWRLITTGITGSLLGRRGFIPLRMFLHLMSISGYAKERLRLSLAGGA